jgi:hypothetical protein
VNESAANSTLAPPLSGLKDALFHPARPSLLYHDYTAGEKPIQLTKSIKKIEIRRNGSEDTRGMRRTRSEPLIHGARAVVSL